MGLMEIFSNPETMHSLSMGEKMLGGCVTMLMGMGITFCVLLLLWAFIAIMGRIMNSVSKKGDKAPAQAEAAATPSAAAAPVASDDSLIAVIAAAIAAYEGNGSNLVVRKISRISGEATPWSTAAKEDCIDSRRF